MESQEVNYIAHLNTWFSKSFEDRRLHSSHIALYTALFQFWNLNRFQNPFIIIREDTMKAAKIGSKTTYIKCLKQLHEWNYIKYKPSYNPHRGSLVHLNNLEKGSGNATVQEAGKAVVPLYKHKKQNKHINKNIDQSKNYQEPL